MSDKTQTLTIQPCIPWLGHTCPDPAAHERSATRRGPTVFDEMLDRINQIMGEQSATVANWSEGDGGQA